MISDRQSMITFYTDIRCCQCQCVVDSWVRYPTWTIIGKKILVAGRSCQHCCLYYSTRLLIYVGGKKTMWVNSGAGRDPSPNWCTSIARTRTTSLTIFNIFSHWSFVKAGNGNQNLQVGVKYHSINSHRGWALNVERWTLDQYTSPSWAQEMLIRSKNG